MPLKLLRDPLHGLAFGLGLGLAPRAPGTFGTLLGLPLFAWLGGLPLWLYVGTVLCLALLGVWICGRAAEALGVHDHPGIVWDEVVGYLVAMMALPVSLSWMLAGFVAFRLFDICKPWLIRVLDRRVGGGAGIMLDDIAAGLFACGVLHAVRFGLE